MGDWGFSDFKRYLKFQLGQRPELEAAGDDSENLYGVWVNLAYRELTKGRKLLGKEYGFRFPQIETSGTDDTADGTAYVDVPSGCIYVEDIYDETSNRWLEPISHRTYVEYTDRSDTNAEGEPTEWVRRGSYVYIHPTADAIYSLRMYYAPLVAILTGTAPLDTTLIGAEWDEIVLQLALVKALRWTKDYEAMGGEAKALGTLLDQMVGVYKKEELGRQPFIRADRMALGRGEGYK